MSSTPNLLLLDFFSMYIFAHSRIYKFLSLHGTVKLYLAAGVICSCCSHKPRVAAVAQFCQRKTSVYLNTQ